MANEPSTPGPPADGDTAPAGLTSAEAGARLARDGPNRLPLPRQPSPARQLLAQMTHFFAFMLWVAAVLAFLAGLPQLGVAIVVIVIVNGSFAFAQEYRAERAVSELRDLVPRRTTVRRDGRRTEVDAADLVVGDLVLLEGGDRVSADLEAIESHSLRVDESLLTGESRPVRVAVGDHLPAGALVVEGEAITRVVAIGSETRLAAIARLTQDTHRSPTPLARELGRVVHLLARVAIGVGVTFFLAGLGLGIGWNDGLVLAIGVTVALVPEGLLPTVTLSLALGAQRMAREHALVRRLEAVETLGSTTFICTDKTGTLTRNEMAVVRAWTPGGTARIKGTGYEPTATIEADTPVTVTALGELARVARASSTGRAVERDGGWAALGDPMDAAIDALANRTGAPLVDQSAVQARYPFDPRRRRASVVADDVVMVKGAPDSVLPRCRDDAATGAAHAALDALTAEGLRVLAVARRAVNPSAPAPPDADTAESDLEILGLLGFEDPPREGVGAAVQACRRAGVRVAMVTGDHPATALAVAREVGLVDDEATVLIGSELPAADDELGALLDRDGVVVARVDPEDKLRIAHALRSRGHVVAMTGDGVNDGPALQEADIGIAMGRSGTDVAREAADLVLLDDHFATIVAAIEQGRATYANVRRFLTYHLTDNVAELTPFVVWGLSGGTIPLALGVLQVLCLDIGTDLLPALALGAEPPAAGTLDRPPPRRHLLDRPVLARVFAVLGPAEAAVEMAAFFVTFLAAGWRPGEPFPGGSIALQASGAAFTAVVVGQMANAFACRSTRRPVWRQRLGTNRLLLFAVATSLAALAGFLFIPPLADLLDQAVPSLAGFGVALLAVPAVLAVDGLHKARLARTHPFG
ncbi:MAG: cation-transporting P-type ATPase [Acidimicrobiia bacterium]|jgi:calcium-translocating P-type ATPase